MAVFVIVYHLGEQGQQYKKIIERIKSNYFSGWAKLSGSSYAVSSNQSAATIAGWFTEFIDSTDQLYVLPLGSQWAAFRGDPKVVEWLQHTPG